MERRGKGRRMRVGRKRGVKEREEEEGYEGKKEGGGKREKG